MITDGVRQLMRRELLLKSTSQLRLGVLLACSVQQFIAVPSKY